jgi:DNA invertase Pin-like site-specific DNA recombinase
MAGLLAMCAEIEREILREGVWTGLKHAPSEPKAHVVPAVRRSARAFSVE